MFALHDTEQSVDVESRTIVFVGFGQRVELPERFRKATADRYPMSLKVRADDVVTCQVECTSKHEPFRHAHTRHENGFWAEGGRGPDAPACRCFMAEKDGGGVADEEEEAREGEEEETDENETEVLGEV